MAVTGRIPGRLFSWRLVVGLHTVLLATIAVFAAMALVESGPSAPAAWGVCLGAVLLWVAAVKVTLVPRRTRQLPAPEPGARLQVDSPRLLVVCLLGAWLLLLGAVAWWLVILLTDPGALDNPGWVLVMGLGAVLSLPDLLRLLTGRLRRWRLVADSDGVGYQGYRTSWQVPWSRVTAVTAQARPPGVVVATTGGDADRFVPAVCFEEPVEQLAEIVAAARTRARGGG